MAKAFYHLGKSEYKKNGLVFTGLFFILCLNAASQNLISNPSFEERNCTAKSIDDIKGWFTNKKEFEIHDYFNGCLDDNRSFFGRPLKVLPFNGESYIKIPSLEVAINAPDPYMIGNVLISEMDSGYKYYFSSRIISHYNRRSNIILINRFNVKFLSKKPKEGVWIENQPFFGTFDLRFNGFELTDSLNWIKISSVYTSKGQEMYFVYGCFEPFDSLAFKDFYRFNTASLDEVTQLLDAFTLIAVPELPNDTSFCEGDTLYLTPRCPKGTFYEWSSGQKGGALMITQPGTYWVMNYSDFDTVKQEIVVRMQGAKPQLPKHSLCGADIFHFNLNEFYKDATINWFDGDTSSQRDFINSGNFSFAVNVSACSVNDTLRIIKVEPPNALKSNYAFCINSPHYLSSGTTVYDSIFWQGNQAIDSFTTEQSDSVYRQVFIDSCVFYDSTFVSVYHTVSFNPIDTLLCLGSRIELTFDSLNVIEVTPKFLSISDTGQYKVLYYDGCDSALIVVNVKESEDCVCNVFIPNAFSPNAEPPNDTFYISVDCEIVEQKFEIYNRWGQRIYESNETTNWSPDGFPQGIYLYKWSATLNKNGVLHNLFRYGPIQVYY